eukprot:8014844-Pyramimonas_sp.AAC.1
MKSRECVWDRGRSRIRLIGLGLGLGLGRSCFTRAAIFHARGPVDGRLLRDHAHNARPRQSALLSPPLL